MKRRWHLVVMALVAMAPACAGETGIFSRPVPAAGENSTTLLVYDTLAKPFSLVNEVAVISTLLGRIQTRVETRQADAVTVAEMAAADYLVVVGVSGVPRLPEPVRKVLAEGSRPAAYVGWAAPLAVSGRGPVPRWQTLREARVTYAGGEWTMDLDPFIAIGTMPSDPLAVVVSPAPRRSLAWRDGTKFAFASLPVPGTVSLIFSDLLLDFYAVGSTPPPALVYLVQDFHPGCEAGAFRRLVDYFAAQGDRFAVSVRLKPALASGAAPMPDAQFFEALRYAQTHGGRVVLRPETSADQVRRLLEEGVVPLACEWPSGAKRPARALQGISYGTALGRIEAAGPQGAAQAVSASSVMTGGDGVLVIPLNVDPAQASTSARGIAAEVAELARLRGTLVGVVIPAWFPFQKMRDAVDEARRSGLRGTDLAAAPNWIKTERAIVTGKHVRRAFSVPDGRTAERVTFDGNFRRIAQGGGESPVATAILLQQER
jgi:hypothetical protein